MQKVQALILVQPLSNKLSFVQIFFPHYPNEHFNF
jgi:hypothetical protein